MTVLPIAERELRVAARGARTYWSRVLVALGSIVLVAVLFAGYEPVVGSRVGGEQLFTALACLAFAYALFAGTALTADCLSREKREETLGLLFLTDLKGYDVVLGKLFATSLRSIYGLFATFPVLSLPLLLGGVRVSEFWRVILVVLNTLLLSLSMGLLVSTVYRRQRVTTHLASLSMLLLALAPVVVSAAIRATAGGMTAVPYDPSIVSPLYSLYAGFDNGYRMAGMLGPSFWVALLVQFVLGAILLLRACWLLPRCWQDSTAPGRQLRTLIGQWRGLREPARVRAGPVLDRNPIYWLAARGRGATLGLTALIILVGAWGFQVRDDREEFAAAQGVGILLVALVSRMLIAVVAAQRLAEDKESGALDLIITTPISVETILEGQWQAIWKKLAWPLVGSMGLYAFLIFGAERAENETALWFTAICFLILSIGDAVALGWLGMWTGLQVRNVPHGAAVCLGKVVLPPALVAGACVCNYGLTSADEYIKTNPYWIPALWLGVGLITDAGWSRWARTKLFTEFRQAATDRLAPTPAAVPSMSTAAQVREQSYSS